MSTQISMVLAILAIPALVIAWSRIRQSAADPYEKALVGVTVVGGVFYQSNLLPRSSLTQLAIIGVTGLAALNIRSKGSRQASGGGTAVHGVVILIMMWVVMFVVNANENQGLDDIQVFGRLLPLAMWVFLFLVVSVRALDFDLLAWSMLLALATVSIAGLAASTTSRPCDEFKCGVLGQIHTGPFDSENYLGILCVLTVVATCATFTDRDRPLRHRAPVYVLVSATLLVTASRSSMIAAICGILFIAFCRRAGLETDRRAAPRAALGASVVRVYARLLPWMMGTVGLALIYTAAGERFSNRGSIWVQARELLRGHEVFGLGIGRWTGYGEVLEVSHHFPHSVYLMTYFSGGIVSLFLLLLLVASAINRVINAESGLIAVTAYATTLLVLGLTEVVFNAMTVDGLTWVILPLLAQVRSPRTEEQDVVPEPALRARASSRRDRQPGSGGRSVSPKFR